MLMADEVLEGLATAYRFRKPALPFAAWLEEQFAVEREVCRTDVRQRVRAASEALGKRKKIRVTPLAVAVPVAAAPVERATWRKVLEDVRAWVKREAVEA
jgi:hypothetical protein